MARNRTLGETCLVFRGKRVSLCFTNGLIYSAYKAGIDPVSFWPDVNGEVESFIAALAWLLKEDINARDKIECEYFISLFDNPEVSFAALMCALTRDGVISVEEGERDKPATGEKKKEDHFFAFAKYRAEARQRLGLSISEFDALTPAEAKIQIAASESFRNERRLELCFLDMHLARIECYLLREGNPKDYRLVRPPDEANKPSKAQRERQRKADETHMQIMAAAQENLRRRKRL